MVKAHIRRSSHLSVKSANRNIHDHSQWDFAYNMSEFFRIEHKIELSDWQTQQTVHYLYEFFNTPHLDGDDRLWLASRYLQDKIDAIRSQRAQVPVTTIYADPIFQPRKYADKYCSHAV